MLVLTRRPQESLVFPDVGITVVVCSIDGNRVRLGIEAPGIRVFRDEIMDRVDPWRITEKPQEETDGGAK